MNYLFQTFNKMKKNFQLKRNKTFNSFNMSMDPLNYLFEVAKKEHLRKH